MDMVLIAFRDGLRSGDRIRDMMHVQGHNNLVFRS